jgi:hypothetical protein
MADPRTQLKLKVVRSPAPVRRQGGHRTRRVRVGKAWTIDQIDLVAHERRARISMAVWLGVFLAAMVAAFAGFAIWSGNTVLLSDVFGIVRVGVFALMAWAFGPRLFKMVSGVRFQDPDDEENKN